MLYRLFFLFLFSIFNVTLAAGLRIRGNSYPIENRSSLEFNKHLFISKSHFVLGFEVKLLDESSFGSIVRLKFQDPNIVYNIVFKKNEDNSIEFKLNEEGKKGISTFYFDENKIETNQWFHITLDIDVKSKTLKWNIFDKSFETILNNFNSEIDLENIFFGKSEYNIDVADFELRKINVFSDNNSFFIPLNESKGKNVHLSDGTIIGRVVNPVWLINESYYWKKNSTFKINSVGGYQFNYESGEVIIFTRDSIRTIDVNTGKLSKYKFPSPLPLDIQLGNSFIHENQLFIYDVNNLPIGDCSMVSVDLKTFEVKCISFDQLDMQLHHHTSIHYDNNLLIYGGFGNDRYSNSFLSMNLKNAVWDTVNVMGDEIYPRYFTSSFFDPLTKSMYVFGGMGNQAGDHTIGRKYFYDLYRLDLNSFRIKKIWNVQDTGMTRVPVKNLISDQKGEFYTLMYSEYLSDSKLQLYKFKINEPKFQVLGDVIPIKSEKIKTNANLFYYDHLKTFYAVTEVFDDQDISSVITVYELKTPAVGLADLNFYESAEVDYKFWLFISITFLVLFMFILYWWRFKNKKKVLNPLIPKSEEVKVMEKIDFTFPTKNRIHLFGDFTVIDKEGKDITYLFSTRLRQMLALFLVTNINKGLKSNEISESLWPDKELTASKNIRGVTINQLRKLLNELEGIDLVYNDHRYTLEVKGCYVDYLRFEMIQNEKLFNIELKEILKPGAFLKGFEDDIFDSIKSCVDTKAQEILQKHINQFFENEMFEFAVELTRLYYSFDPLSEEMLRIELKSLVRLGNRVEARKAFEHYQKVYVSWVNEEFPLSFESMLK